MMDTQFANNYLDKIVETFKDCVNDRKEIVASPCYKLEFRNQSEEQILFEHRKNKSKASPQADHINGSSLNGKLRPTYTPKPSSDDENDEIHNDRRNQSDLSLNSTLNNSQLHPQGSSSGLNSNRINQDTQETKPNKISSRGSEMLNSLREKVSASKEANNRAISPSTAKNLTQEKKEEYADNSNLDMSIFDMYTSRIGGFENKDDRLEKSGVSDMTLDDNEGDYPDKKEKSRLIEDRDLLSQTLRHTEPKTEQRMENKREKEEEKQEQPLGESKKLAKIQELRQKYKEKTAEQKRAEEEGRKKKEEEEAERLREEERQRQIEKERREKEEREEKERIQRKEKEEREEKERALQRAREIEREKAKLEAQIREEKEAKERQRLKEEQLRREEEEEEQREKERQRMQRLQREEEQRKKIQKEEARLIADEIKNQRNVIESVQIIKEDMNPISKQSEWPTSNMQNSFSFQQGSLHESQYDMTPGSPKSQSSEKMREQRQEGTNNLLNGMKASSRRMNREGSRQGSNVDSTETRDRFENRSVSGQRTIPDRLKRIEELLERVLESQMNLEKRLEKIEETQEDQTDIIEEIRDKLS